MIKQFTFLFLSLCLVACSGNDSKSVMLTSDEKSQIERFSESLVATFNNHDYRVVNDSWNSSLFRQRISGLNKTQRSVLSHIYEEGVKNDIRYENLLIINGLSKQDGKAYLSKVDHFNAYSEITLLLILHESFGLVKYRVEMNQAKPNLTDLYNFKDNTWYSESVKNMINLNVRYDSFTKERAEANQALRRAEAAEKDGDAEGALYWLNKIPKTHWFGNGLSLRKIELATKLDQDKLTEVLEAEYEHNQSLYMQYLYHSFFGDDAKLNQVFTYLKDMTDGGDRFDSLIRNKSNWF